MKGRTIYRYSDTGIEVTVSKPAEELIGSASVPEFVTLLTELLQTLGVKGAYVSKAGAAVEIHFCLVTGQPETWTVPVKR